MERCIEVGVAAGEEEVLLGRRRREERGCREVCVSVQWLGWVWCCVVMVQQAWVRWVQGDGENDREMGATTESREGL